MLENKFETWELIGWEFVKKIKEFEFLGDKFNEKKFIEWWNKREKLGLRFDWKMYARCYYISNELNNENDHMTVIEGPEGSGKTTVAVQIGSCVSPDMGLKHILFKVQDHIELMIKYIENVLKKGKTIKESLLMDEGALNLYSREAMSKSNRNLSKMFMVQRALNLHSEICIPRFADLDTYSRKHRVKTLILTYKRRGDYKCIVGKGIDIVNKALKKGLDPRAVTIPPKFWWHGHFRKGFPSTIDEDKYKIHKLRNLKDFLIELKETKEEGMPLWVKAANVARMCDVTVPGLKNFIQRGEIQGKKMLGSWHIHKDSVKKLISKNGG